MKLTPQLLFSAYSQGYFPMAESRYSEGVLWHLPDPRAIIPLNNISIPHSSRKIFNKNIFSFSIDKDFPEVILKCAEREETWINNEIISAYIELHKLGFAHSVEARIEGKLVGGLYGVHIGGAFFGESMFNTVDNASKLCFYYLCAILVKNNFLLLDSQYGNPHTYSLCAIDITSDEYFKLLNPALNIYCDFMM